MPGKKRSNAGANYGATNHRAYGATREARPKLVVSTSAYACADGESAAKSNQRTDGSSFAASPATPAVAFYLEHVLLSGGHRPGRHLQRRPALERAVDLAGFQGEANVIAWTQLRKRLPVVPILRLSCGSERA
jgi:hypothetical protein